MKRVLFICLLLPLFALSQTKNVVTVERYFPKVDKVLEFEKGLANHTAKYHSGDLKWRVYEIASGPDAGGYHITEGPNSWDGLDTRGNISPEHTADWNKNVAPFLTDRFESMYFAYQEELSSVALGAFSDKIQIVHWFPKVGYLPAVRTVVGKMKKVWDAEGTNEAVYLSSGSGQTQLTLVTRYKNGFKERGVMNPVSYKDRYEKLNGADSFDEYEKMLQNNIDKSWSELLTYRADLSSK